MARLYLVHWDADEAPARAKLLRGLGHVVSCHPIGDPTAFKRMRAKPPELFVICLDRLPSHGRHFAGTLTGFKTTRDVPILFVGGEPEKVTRVKDAVPRAHFTTWKRIDTAIQQAMANPPSLSALPAPAGFPGYSGTPLPKKLGIKEGSRVALAAAPPEFERTLGKLPAGATLHTNPRGKRELTVWFVRSLKELRAAMPRMLEASRQGGVWIAWPKKTSALASDVSEREVRALGLAAGMVDYKICAIDETWSGLKFALRRREAATPTRSSPAVSS